MCTASSSLGVGCGGVFLQASTSMSHVRTEWKSFFRKNEYDMSLVMTRHTCCASDRERKSESWI